jgi:hypothetical protein
LAEAEAAFYFSGATYTTVGSGDVVLATKTQSLAFDRSNRN